MQDVVNRQSLKIDTLFNEAETIVNPRVRRQARLISVDIVRGIAMLFMLLSHSADDIMGINYNTAYRWDMNNIATLTSIEEWIGFVLHLSSPIFFLLAGMSLAFFIVSRIKREWQTQDITRFLLIRGAVLIVIDQLVLKWQFTTMHYYHYVGVLSTIGLCIFVLAGIWRWRLRYVALLAAVVLFSVQIYHYFNLQPDTPTLLHTLFLGVSSNVDVSMRVTFPVLAWLPVMLLGLIVGRLLKAGRVQLAPFSLLMGSGLLASWVVIRLIGGFGNYQLVHPLVFTKVPPDLAFFAFYLGFSFLLLWAFTRFTSLTQNVVARVLLIYGQTALFFYVLHAEFVLNVFTRVADDLPLNSPLLVSLVATGISAVVLYFLCVRYRDLRRNHPESVLKYL